MMLSSAMQGRFSKLANVCIYVIYIHTASLLFLSLAFSPFHPSLTQEDMSNFLIRFEYDVGAYNVLAAAPLDQQMSYQGMPRIKGLIRRTRAAARSAAQLQLPSVLTAKPHFNRCDGSYTGFFHVCTRSSSSLD